MAEQTTYQKAVTTRRSLSSGMATATQVELHQVFAFGDKVVARYRDYGTPAQRTKTYMYYTDITDNGYGKVAKRVDFDGRWTKYEYDSSGRLIKEVSPFGDAADTVAESLCQVITYDYAKLDPAESADDADTPRWRTRITFVCGQETARRYRQFFANVEKNITSTAADAAWDAVGNRVKTTYYQNYYDDFCGENLRRETRVEDEDGTVREIAYVDSTYYLENPPQTVYITQKTTLRKFQNSSISREVETLNHFGTVESYRRYDLSGGVELLVEGYDQTVDRYGRPLVRTGIDGDVTRYEYYTAQVQDGGYTSVVPFRHVQTTLPDGSVRVEAFDLWDERIFTLYDGIRTFFRYDVYGNVLSTTVTGRNGGTLVTSSSFSNDNVRLSDTDANGNVTTYSQGSCWDARTDALGNVFRNEYFLDGRLKCVKVNGEVKNYYAYSVVGNELVETEYASAAEWSRKVTGFDGNLRKEAYPDGYVKEYEYDAYGRQSLVSDNCGNRTRNVYSATTGELVRQWENAVLTEFASGAATDADTLEIYEYKRTFAYCQSQRVMMTEARSYRGGLKTWEFEKEGIVQSVKSRSGDGAVSETKTENGIATVYNYLNDRLVSSQNMEEGLVEYVYDEFNRLVGRDYTEGGVAKSVRRSLDGNGNVLTFMMAAGNSSRTYRYAYDVLDRRTEERSPENLLVVYAYDAQGNVIRVSGNVHPRECARDLHGRITGLTTWRDANTPESTAFAYDCRGRLCTRTYHDGSAEEFSYRGDGAIATVVNARGQTVMCSYDRFNRLVAIQGGDVHWDFAYDYQGRLLWVGNGTFHQNFGYDAYGRLVSENFSDISGTEIVYSRDAYGRLDGYSFDGETVNYGHSTYTGRLASVSCGDWSFLYSRIPGGVRLASMAAKLNNLAVHVATRSYNAMGDLTALDGHGYTLNLDGRREGATLPDGRTWSYAYDSFSQITGAVLEDNGVTVSSYAYSYDQIGNRLASNDNGLRKNYTANNLNQYTAVNNTAFTYDADGNLLSDGVFTYGYDTMNQLVSVEDGTHRKVFSYDFMGRRIVSESYAKANGEWGLTERRRYIYWEWNVIAEYVNGVKAKTYVWGEDMSGTLQGAGGVGGLLLERDGEDAFLPVYDGNGNITAYLDAAGSMVASYAYDPFGNIIAHAGLDFFYRFSTKPQDVLGSLYYYGYRFYYPQIGRWVNRDPLIWGRDENLYSLVFNNSVNNIDYLGLELWNWIPIIPTINNFIKIPKGMNSNDYECHPPQSDECCDNETKALITCEKKFTGQLLGFIKEYAGITIGPDAMKALIGGTLTYVLSKIAIKYGGRMIIGGAITSGVLTIDGFVDLVITVNKLFKMYYAAKEKREKCCVCK